VPSGNGLIYSLLGGLAVLLAACGGAFAWLRWRGSAKSP
jgi:hypothetical protein